MAMRSRSPKRASDLKPDPAEHYTRLADEFGMPRGGRYTMTDDGRPITGARFWLQPLTLFILSLIALVAVCAVQFWRLGVFDPIFGPKGALVDTSSKRWILNGRSARPATVSALAEPDIDRGPAPVDDQPDDTENTE